MIHILFTAPQNDTDIYTNEVKTMRTQFPQIRDNSPTQDRQQSITGLQLTGCPFCLTDSKGRAATNDYSHY